MTMPVPTLEGRAGRAWRIAAAPQNADQTACLCQWLVEVPGAHAFWSRWTIAVVHLRSIEGVKPAVLKFPEATHEFTTMAIDPATYSEHEELPPKRGWAWMEPIDVVVQFQVGSDQEAKRIAELAVEMILAGQASPDEDYRSWWEEVPQKTARHCREGRHAVA